MLNGELLKKSEMFSAMEVCPERVLEGVCGVAGGDTGTRGAPGDTGHLLALRDTIWQMLCVPGTGLATF